MKGFLHIIILCLVGAGALAQSHQIDAQLNAKSTEIKIGEQIKMHLQVRFPVTDTVVFPNIGDTLMKYIEVVERSKIDTMIDEDDITTMIYQQDLVVTSFDSGFHAIPPIVFKTNKGDVGTDPMLITVHSVPVDLPELSQEQAEQPEVEIKDIKGNFEVGWSFYDWFLHHWKWLVPALVLVILFVVYIVFFYEKKVVEQKVVKQPKTPFDVEARKKLEVIKAEKIWKDGKVKKYHSDISEVIREFIEKRFDAPALEQTTEEILTALKYKGLLKESEERLQRILQLADLVKFAKAQPVSYENEQSLDDAFQFVDENKPTPVESTPPPATNVQAS